MNHKILTTAELGALIRATRKSAGIGIEELAAKANLSKQFVNSVELGKSSVHFGKVLQLLAEVNVEIFAVIPEIANDKLIGARIKISNTTHRRAARKRIQTTAAEITKDSKQE